MFYCAWDCRDKYWCDVINRREWLAPDLSGHGQAVAAFLGAATPLSLVCLFCSRQTAFLQCTMAAHDDPFDAFSKQKNQRVCSRALAWLFDHEGLVASVHAWAAKCLDILQSYAALCYWAAQLFILPPMFCLCYEAA